MLPSGQLLKPPRQIQDLKLHTWWLEAGIEVSWLLPSFFLFPEVLILEQSLINIARDSVAQDTLLGWQSAGGKRLVTIV